MWTPVRFLTITAVALSLAACAPTGTGEAPIPIPAPMGHEGGMPSMMESPSGASREPKDLQSRITVDMVETASGMSFATSEGVLGGPFRVTSGQAVGLHLVNRGHETHEFMAGQRPRTMQGQTHGYEVNLFQQVAGDVFVYPSGIKVEVGQGRFEEIEVGPGADVWIRANFPAAMKGEWEMGCFVQEPDEKSHYQQGMKATLIIE